MSTAANDGAEQDEPRTPDERPGLIDAVPVRHPGRWVAIAVIAVIGAMFVNMLLTNPEFDWPFIFQAMVQRPVINGLLMGTLLVTVMAMVIGISGGVILAVMRLSGNPVLSVVAWVFTWFFRAVPRLVLLTVMGALGILFKQGMDIGVPFDQEILGALGIDGSMRFLNLDANAIFTGVIGGAIGLGLSEAAYMAEIARAGIMSVDPGQREAAKALGMSNGMAMRRVILPQAMRVIVPPTGNETIAMVKDTSLLIGIPLSAELFFQLQSIGSRLYQTFNVLIAATLWYLIVCSVLMVGQYFLEKRFGRGYGATRPDAKKATTRTRLMGLTVGGSK
ncbi:amino acid ABC transporter permease [Janibacter sp. GXQ6167]|uniref:amino acid ABC transporter permease n=1 Tax=Janibacter sp. GXQ6167 TaxID=3240791 RepID=UPI0035231E98